MVTVLSAPWTAASAQNPPSVEIRDCVDPCPTIALDTLLRIGSPDDPVLFDFLSWSGVLRTSEGLFVVAENMERGVVAIYNPDGSFKKVVGRPGSGPGEFKVTESTFGPGGQIWIEDPANLRVTELTADGELGSSFRMIGNFVSAIPVGEDRVLAHARIPKSPDPRRPYHIVAQGGEVLRSFGTWPDTRVPGFSSIGMKGGASSFWSLMANEYRIEEWSLDGELRRVFVRDVEWFPEPWNVEPSPGLPGMLFIDVDEFDNLWVIGRIPVSGTTPRRGYLDSYNQAYDLILEVIDPREMRVIAWRRLDEVSLRPMPGPEWLFTQAHQTELGYVMMDVIRPRIAQ